MDLLSYPALFVKAQDCITAKKTAYLEKPVPLHTLPPSCALTCLFWADQQITADTQRSAMELFAAVLQEAPACTLISPSEDAPRPNAPQPITAHFIAQAQLTQDDTPLLQALRDYHAQAGGYHWFFVLGDTLPARCAAPWLALFAQPCTVTFFSADPHQLWLSQTLALQQAVLVLLASYGVSLAEQRPALPKLAVWLFTQPHTTFCLHGHTSATSDPQLTQLILSQLFSRVFPQAFQPEAQNLPAEHAPEGLPQIALPAIQQKFEALKNTHLPTQAQGTRYLPITMPSNPQDLLAFLRQAKMPQAQALTCFRAANYLAPVAALAGTEPIVELTKAFQKKLCAQYSLAQLHAATPFPPVPLPECPAAQTDCTKLHQMFLDAAEAAWRQLLCQQFNHALTQLQCKVPSQQWVNQWSAEIQRSAHLPAAPHPTIGIEPHTLALFLSEEWQTQFLADLAQNLPPDQYFNTIKHQVHLYKINGILQTPQPVDFSGLPPQPPHCTQTPATQIDFVHPLAKEHIALQNPLPQTIVAPTNEMVLRLQCYALHLPAIERGF